MISGSIQQIKPLNSENALTFDGILETVTFFLNFVTEAKKLLKTVSPNP